MRPVILAGALVVAAAALEGALAGTGVRARLAEVRRPRFSPPFAVWVAIGVLYYASCFAVAYRLVSERPLGTARTLGVTLLTAVVLLNALWNYAFFRRRDLQLTWRISVVYAVFAVALGTSLIVTDPVTALWFLPYLLYLPYATWWTRTLRVLNAPRGSEDERG